MAISSHDLLLHCLGLTSAIALVFYVFRPDHRLPLPPSPKPDPVIGHLRSLPTVNEHIFYAEVSKALSSDIISFTVFGRTIVVLNSAKAAHELLDQRSAIYSDRPELPVFSYPDLLDCKGITGFLRYGERWSNQRKMSHAVLHKKASAQFWPSIAKHSRLAMQRLLTEPNSFFEVVKRTTGAIILSAVYGYEATSVHDPLIEVSEAAVSHLIEAAVPSNFYVNTIPWLRFIPNWFPGTAWKQKVRVWRTEKDEMANAPFSWTKEQIAQGTASPSVLKTLLDELEGSGKTESSLAYENDVIKWTTGTFFGAGAHTTAASIQVFILAMTLHPDVQAQAQAEIDAIVGTDRLPDMEDRHSLPYVERVLKEVLRWQSIGPLGIAHACTKDDEYAGYRIPKDSIVIGNIWAMSNDSSVYINPEIFNPDRFLDPSVPSAPTFGFGRRSCPGVYIAESILYMNMCTLLALFDIGVSQDSQGNAITPSVSMKTNALLSHPTEFKCSIRPRSQKAAELLQAST